MIKKMVFSTSKLRPTGGGGGIGRGSQCKIIHVGVTECLNNAHRNLGNPIAKSEKFV